MDSPVTREEFRRETDNLYSKVNRLDKEVTVLQTMFDNFRDLPESINKLDKTMALISQNLELLNQKVNSFVSSEECKNTSSKDKDQEQDEKIRALDEKSKIDILVFVKTNWWKIVMTIAAFLILFQKYIPA